MRYAVIDQPVPSGAVTNVVSVTTTGGNPPTVQLGQGVVCDPPAAVVAGWVIVGGVFYPSVPSAAVPQTISDRQFFQQLAVLGLITQSEAIAAVGTGAIPSEMQSALQSLPSSAQFAATMKLTGATTFDRTDPLVEAFAAAQTPPMTSAQLDALWQAAALL